MIYAYIVLSLSIIASVKTRMAQTTISRIAFRQADIRSNSILAIVEACPNLNVERLVTGKGEIWKHDEPQEREKPMTDGEGKK